jgi:hypothetical protein
MRKSNFEKMKEAKKRQDTKLVLTGIDDLYKYLLGGPMLPTQRRLIYGSEFARAYPGPAGCAKTSTLAAFGWGRALLVPGSKIFVSRQNYNDLMDTTMGDMIAMLDKLPRDILLDRDKSPPMKWWVKPIYTEGTPDDVQVSQFTFTGLTDDLGSLKATCWLVDEAHEVDEKRAREALSRLRAPGVPKEDYCGVFVFNPPAKTHWLYTACTGLDHQGNKVAPPWMTMYKPLPNENIKNLREGYYDDLAATLTPEQKQRLVDGEWGNTFPGKAVYREFQPSQHIVQNARYNPDRPLLRFWDFGYGHPVCLWAQLSPFGHLTVLRELMGEREEVDPFALRVKIITAEEFPNAEVTDYGDPAVKQHKDTGSSLAKLFAAGIQIRYRSSRIADGVGLIRKLLQRIINGGALLQFSESGCPILIEAMRGGYHLDLKKGEEPVKDGFYDHPADAYRYGVINVFAGMLGREEHVSSDLPDNLSYDPAEDNYV